jgi:hypothetical protein
MVAAAPGPAPGQIATLADLKRDLRSAQAERGTPVVRDDLRPGQIRVDVVKGSF